MGPREVGEGAGHEILEDHGGTADTEQIQRSGEPSLTAASTAEEEGLLLGLPRASERVEVLAEPGERVATAGAVDGVLFSRVATEALFAGVELGASTVGCAILICDTTHDGTRVGAAMAEVIAVKVSTRSSLDILRLRSARVLRAAVRRGGAFGPRRRVNPRTARCPPTSC
ncbi:MAG: hypothetical protein JW751_28555 [Polyangiaceae bacterium]|nr:hypothetical protein [Polyangiaceae bacterium]